MRKAFTVCTALLCAGALAGPATSLASSISVSGVVHCSGGAVVGVWIQSTGGGSKFAGWRPFNTSTADATYAAQLSTSLPTKLQLRVGCGGSKAKWGTTNNSPYRSASGSKILNAFCDGRGVCSWPKKGKTTSGNLGYEKQCTEGAFNEWHKYTGFWPYWRGSAAEWSKSAATYGYSVTTVAMPKSVVVFPATTKNSAGHVAWVDSISQNSSGAITLNVIEENFDGTASKPTGHIRRYSYAASSKYRYIPAP